MENKTALNINSEMPVCSRLPVKQMCPVVNPRASCLILISRDSLRRRKKETD